MSSPVTRHSSASRSQFASFFDIPQKMFRCGGCASNVLDDDHPQFWHQASLESFDEAFDSEETITGIAETSMESPSAACVSFEDEDDVNMSVEDGNSFYYSHVVQGETFQTIPSSSSSSSLLSTTQQPNLQHQSTINGRTIPISPVTRSSLSEQHKPEQKQETPAPTGRALSSSSNDDVEMKTEESSTTAKSATATTTATSEQQHPPQPQPQAPRFEMLQMVVPTTKSRANTTAAAVSVDMVDDHPVLKYSLSDCTQSTHSMSDSDVTPLSLENNIESSNNSESKAKPVVVSILRRKKRKLGEKPIVQPSTMVRVSFHESTKFPDPTSEPVKRKACPRLTPRQKQEYALNQGWIYMIRNQAKNFHHLPKQKWEQFRRPQYQQFQQNQNQQNQVHRGWMFGNTATGVSSTMTVDTKTASAAAAPVVGNSSIHNIRYAPSSSFFQQRHHHATINE